MSENRYTVPALHGDVEYETVVCGSCDQEVLKEHANRFIVAGTYKKRSGYNRDRISDVKAVGWACPYCTDAGPIGFPSAGRFDAVPASARMFATALVGVARAVRGAHANFISEQRDNYDRGWYGLYLMSWVGYVLFVSMVAMLALLMVSVVVT